MDWEASQREDSACAENGISRRWGGVTTLHKFNPENNKSVMSITSTHIRDELYFRRGMLIRMMVRSSGAVTKKLQGAIKASFPAVNILSVGFVFDGIPRDAMFFSVIDKR